MKSLQLYKDFTSAGNTNILIVVTVVDAPAQTMALAEICFTSSAVHIIQQDGAGALSELRAGAYRHGYSTAQLPTDHVGIHHVPVVITHRAPCFIVATHLHPTFTPVTAIHQSHFGEMNRQSVRFILPSSGCHITEKIIKAHRLRDI